MADTTVNYIFNAETGKLESGMKNVNNSFDTTDKKAQSLTDKFSSMGKGITIAGGVLTAFGVAGVKAIQSVVESANTQIEVETKLEEVMKTRMNATDDSVQSIKDYASELQTVGVIGDEVQLAGAQQVATFLNQSDSIKTLLPAMNNLAAQQKGVSATQEDMINYGNLFGKVMQGQTSALSRVGITFTEAQEEILKYGNEQERAATLAQVVNDNVGNMNETLAETPEGQMTQLSNDLGDIAETVGIALLPTLLDLVATIKNKVLPKLQEFADFFNNNEWASKGALAIVGLSLAFGGLFLVIGPLLIMLPTLVTVVGALFSPITLVVGAIASLVAYFGYMYTSSEEFRNTINGIITTIKETFLPIFETLKTQVGDAFSELGSALNEFFSLFSSNSSSAEGQANAFGLALQLLSAIGVSAFAILSGIVEGFVDTLTGIVQVVTGIINGDWAMIWQGAQKLLLAPFQVIDNVLTSIFGDAFIKSKEKAIEKLNQLVTWVKGLPSKIANGLSNIGSKFSTAFQNAKNKAIEKGQDIIDWFKNIPSAIGNALASLPSVVASAFSSAASSALDAVGDLAGSVAGALNPFDYNATYMNGGSVQPAMVGNTTNNTYHVNVKEEHDMSNYGGVQKLQRRLDAL